MGLVLLAWLRNLAAGLGVELRLLPVRDSTLENQCGVVAAAEPVAESRQPMPPQMAVSAVKQALRNRRELVAAVVVEPVALRNRTARPALQQPTDWQAQAAEAEVGIPQARAATAVTVEHHQAVAVAVAVERQ